MRQTAFTAMALIAVALTTQSTCSADLIAYYQAEGNANDSAGGHDGTLVNGAGFGPGEFGQAFKLNGSNQYVSVPDSPAWAFGNNPFTISLWANFDSIRQDILGQLPNVFVGQDEGAGTTNKWVFFYDGNGNLAFHINGPGFVFLTAPTSFVPLVGDWHLYSLTRSGSTYTFYADGVSLGTAISSLAIPDANAPLTIGQAEGVGFVNGRLDDVRIYDRALSGAEIAGLRSVPEPASVAMLLFGGLVAVGYVRRSGSKAQKNNVKA